MQPIDSTVNPCMHNTDSIDLSPGILVSKQQGNDMGAGQSAVAQPHQRQIHTSNKLVNSDLNRIDQSNPGVKTNKSKLNSDEPALSKNQQINEDSQTLLIISKGHTNGRQVTFKSPPTSYTYQRRHAHIRRLPASGAKEPHHVVGVDTAEQHPASPVPATAGKGGDVIERKRRESMQNGDVFIYPSNYRHMNECNKCSRDNKICNCNLAVASEDSTSSDKDSSLQIAAQETARPAIDSGTEDQVTSSTLETDHTLLDGCSRGGLGSTKTYKISIARALLDQKNNQIHLTKPQIIAAIPYSGELGTNTPGAEQQLDKLESVSEALDEPRRTPILTSPTSSPGDLSAISSETPYGFKRLHTAPCETSSGSSLHLSSFELEAGSAAIQSGLKSPVQIAKADSLVLLASPSGPTSGSCRSLGGPEEASSEPSSCPGSSETIKSLTSFCQLDRQASIRRQTSKVTTVSIGANRAPDFQQVSSADHDETMLSKAPVYGEQYDKPICTGARQFIGPQAGLWNQPCQAKLSEEERLSSWPNEASSTLCSNMADEDQELLCNLTIGGSIKITSTSIHVGSTDSACKQLPLDLVTTTAASSSMTASTTTFETTSAITKVNHASIIPIQTLSARRRNMSTSKLCRLAIHEDDGDSFNLPEVDLLQDKSDNKGSVSLLSCPKDHTSTTIVDGISTSADLESLVGTARVGSTMVSIEPGLVRVPVKQESDGIILNSMDTPETAKKSIFEGASKDEILEYFEDARERVPEILMAADDVMVINENELIVVNQLEPGSPATPISIVEAPELLEETLSIPSVTPVDQIVASQANSDQVRERLQQMYQASKQVSSQYIDNNEDSPELDRRIPKLDLLGRPNVSADDAKSDESLTVEVEKRTSEASKLKRHSGSSLRRPASSSVSNTSNSSEPNSTADLQTSISSPMSLFRGRRNSTSAESSSQIERNCAMQMMMLQKRYSNRDSLSSSSSSPPSSCSPSSAGSSTSSSAQTSGNCSVASNFYASSSLSCSSPLLAQAIRLSPSSSSGSPAFNLSLANSCPPEGEQPSSFTNRLISSLISEDATLADPSQVERDDSGLGYESSGANKSSLADRLPGQSSPDAQLFETSPNSATRDEVIGTPGRYPVPAWDEQKLRQLGYSNGKRVASSLPGSQRLNTAKGFITTNSASFASRLPHGHFATVNRLNNYFLNRRSSGDALDGKNEFQCLDCDQFIDVDHATLMSKSNEFRLLREVDNLPLDLIYNEQSGKRLTPSQLDRAYIAAMNGLPLCKSCEKKRVERKEIISEFVETELKYGRDLKIIHDEFYRPMQIAGLLTKDQISGVFLNLEELIMANCRFADRLQSAIGEAHTMADTDYNTINIGRIFVESAEMLHTFETYCIRQGSAACLLARLAKEKELLRIFLRVSQMENTLLRRMNLAAFLMVPVQRVTKYPLLLSRLYKVTAYHHKDREALRDAQLKVELHLEHINQQTKGIGATNKIWRRISNLSAPISNRRGLINTEDIGYIKLRKTALDMLKWDREETQFIHSGKVSFAPLTEYLTKQKMKPLRYMPAHALLIVLGKPNWKYRPDLVKATLDSKLMTPTSGGTGIKETVLLLFREKNGRFVACREPLFLSNCVFSNDFSQFNCEFPHNQPAHHNAIAKSSSPQVGSKQGNVTTGELNKDKSSQDAALAKSGSRGSDVGNSDHQSVGNGSTNGGDAISMSSMKSLNDEPAIGAHPPTSPVYSSRSYSLASALPASAMSASNNGSSSSLSLAKSTSTPSSSNMTILNQLRTKVNIYHKQSSVQTQKLADQSKTTAISSSFHVDDNNNSTSNSGLNRLLDMHASASRHGSPSTTGNTTTLNGTSTANNNNGLSTLGNTGVEQGQHHFNHHFFHNHHQPYGDYEESLEIHDRLTKESILLKADTPLKTRYWLQMLRYHAKDLGVWRTRRNGLANIMMMINKD